VRKLDTCYTTALFVKMDYARQIFHVGVAPDAKILRTDASMRSYCCSLSQYQSGTAYSTAAEVDYMPVIGKTINA
jgi:hypothetical protein